MLKPYISSCWILFVTFFIFSKLLQEKIVEIYSPVPFSVSESSVVVGMFIIGPASSFVPDSKIVLIISYDFQSLPGSVQFSKYIPSGLPFGGQ